MAQHKGQLEENRVVVRTRGNIQGPGTKDLSRKRRHEGRTSQEKGDTRAAGPSVSLFLTSPPRVSPFLTNPELMVRGCPQACWRSQGSPTVVLSVETNCSVGIQTHTTLDKNLSFNILPSNTYIWVKTIQMHIRGTKGKFQNIPFKIWRGCQKWLGRLHLLKWVWGEGRDGWLNNGGCFSGV